MVEKLQFGISDRTRQIDAEFLLFSIEQPFSRKILQSNFEIETI